MNVPDDPGAAGRERYARQLMMPEMGAEGQRRLASGKVLIIGTGGLGSPAALYLAAAGVGTLGILDSDTVEISNLQRQILHSTQQLGQLKVDSARRRIDDLNPEVSVETHPVRLDGGPQNATILSGVTRIRRFSGSFIHDCGSSASTPSSPR